MRKGLLVLLLLATAASSALALPEVVLGPGLNTGRTPYYQTWDRALSADSTYVLTGLYYVEPSHQLSIAAGTIVRGDTAATLIIKPGAQIFASGTAADPIVFTSRKAPGQRAAGDWGGVILLGNAPINPPTAPLIEGGIIGGTYGGPGGTGDPHDDSGVFKYVRIEYCGYRFQLNNEVNGLTMGGVGDGTEISHVQVSYSFDDSFEWFGGTVNCDHLIAFGGTDDEFDSDFGWTGNAQFCFGLRDPFAWDPTGESNGFESDNDGSGSANQPYTFPVFSNVTLIGPARNDDIAGNMPVGHRYQYSAVLRRNSRLSLFNSVIAGYPWGLSIRDGSRDAAGAGDLRVECTSLAANTIPSGSASVHDESRWPLVTLWYSNPASSNIGSAPRLPSTLHFTDLDALGYPNPVPAGGSELIDSACWTDSYLSDPFFTETSYRGAFDPDLPFDQQWTAGWANFNPQYFDVETAAGGTTPAAFELLGSFPNPFNPATEIRFNLHQGSSVDLAVFDLGGRLVRMLAQREGLEAGTHSRVWDGRDDAGAPVASGVYFYRLLADQQSQTAKMTLLK